MKVLIIEDNVILAATLEIMLKKLGHKQIQKVHDAKSALETLKDFKADLLLVDINLGPGKSGIDVVKTVQSERKVDVVYITGNSDVHHKTLVQQTDYLQYLVKPITLFELKNSIAQSSVVEINNKDEDR